MFARIWYPESELLNLVEGMNRVANRMARQNGRHDSLRQTSWTPPVDIAEDDHNFYLIIELPGLEKKDVKVHYENGVLTIKGQKKHRQQDGVVLHRQEIPFGEFERSFKLPEQIDVGKIAANFQRGVLTVTLPKAEEARPKQIDVQIK
ncbi:MAG: Hsp20/alpha crystallin family protein [candidate division KSB1 bacterium]|nr:Hsp20/alpha crystallin family protein [candidate division KSB1 bacterium]